MGNLFDHWYYLLIVLVIVLIVVGPGKLPDVGAGLGRAIREFRKASTETQDAFRTATGQHGSSTPSQESPAQTAPSQQMPAQPASLPAGTAPDDSHTSDAHQQQTPVSS
jgi:sec-independent protein translocase protein TatA